MSELLHEQSIGAFLDALASSAPTPGGGSVSALTGAHAAALLSMVCAILGNRKQPNDANGEIRALHQQADQLQQRFQSLAQDDIEAFTRLATAYRLPQTTEADAASRRAAIQKLTQQAADVPLRTAYAATELLPLAHALAGRCGRLLMSDVGIAVILARATIQSALLNVEINLSYLEDHIFVRQVRAQMQDMTMGLDDEVTALLTTVRGSINR